MYTVYIKNQKFLIDLTQDHYGIEFWDKVDKYNYEPDTTLYIESRCNLDTDNLDLGAANGAMSFIAAINEATVFSYDRYPSTFGIFKKNIDLILNLQEQIEIQNVAISSIDCRISFGNNVNPEAQSSINFLQIMILKFKYGYFLL